MLTVLVLGFCCGDAVVYIKLMDSLDCWKHTNAFHSVPEYYKTTSPGTFLPDSVPFLEGQYCENQPNMEAHLGNHKGPFGPIKYSGTFFEDEGS